MSSAGHQYPMLVLHLPPVLIVKANGRPVPGIPARPVLIVKADGRPVPGIPARPVLIVKADGLARRWPHLQFRERGGGARETPP